MRYSDLLRQAVLKFGKDHVIRLREQGIVAVKYSEMRCELTPLENGIFCERIIANAAVQTVTRNDIESALAFVTDMPDDPKIRESRVLVAAGKKLEALKIESLDRPEMGGAERSNRLFPFHVRATRQARFLRSGRVHHLQALADGSTPSYRSSPSDDNPIPRTSRDL